MKVGKQCIEVTPASKVSFISETLCIGCGLCQRKCPFDAIQIINLPTNLDKDCAHRYGPNSFKLHRLPTPRPGRVLGLVGTNGIGKSTALKVLAGKLKPNLGKFDSPPDWADVLANYRGSELQSYFTKILEDNLKAMIKPQYVEAIPRKFRGTVGDIISASDDSEDGSNTMRMVDILGLIKVMDREIGAISGGELQRFAIAILCVKELDIYMFDEPSSYLDVQQRLAAARAIRSMLRDTSYVIVVEHDLAVLDYLSDFVCCLYGTPGAYGVVTLPYGVREGINVFLDGFIPTENLRFRQESLSFRMHTDTGAEEEGSAAAAAADAGKSGIDRMREFEYPAMTKKLGGFSLDVEPGSFAESEIIVLLGQNGTGKSTFIRMLARATPPENGAEVPELRVSYKPQKILPRFPGTVRELLEGKIRESFTHPQFETDVVKPLAIERLLDQSVKSLSGGELQRVGLVLALGVPADIYLIDEPSAYLDSEQRIIAAKVIKRFIMHARKTAFVVEHDFIMATYLADRVIVYEGTPSVKCTAKTPQGLVTGMNAFLESLGITFRRDPTNLRPRINKLDSQLDKTQKLSGNYFFEEEVEDKGSHEG